MTFAEAEERPFETIMSGPVAGAEGAGELARSLGIDSLITADVGGTSFDTCLVSGGRPQLMYEGMVVGLPVQTPWVDVRSIGAGGGSIAYIDVGGLLQVGPQSAGADPGPASYGRGGTEPTVTDCALSLGMLGEGKLASGITLDVGKARTAIEPVAAKLNFTIDQAAQGVMTIVTASMANTIREITIDQGVDPRQATLLAFGGAGPLMACALARELNIGSIVIPPYAGNFSAWGLLGADLTQAAARTKIMKLSDDALAEANDILKDLFATLEERQGPLRDGQSRSREVGLDMRYAGQEHNLTVPMEAPDGVVAASAEAVLEAFTQEYERTFRNTMEGGRGNRLDPRDLAPATPAARERVQGQHCCRWRRPRRGRGLLLYRGQAAAVQDRGTRIACGRRYGRGSGHRHGGDRDDLSRCRLRSAARCLRLPVPEVSEGVSAPAKSARGAIRPTPP